MFNENLEKKNEVISFKRKVWSAVLRYFTMTFELIGNSYPSRGGSKGGMGPIGGGRPSHSKVWPSVAPNEVNADILTQLYAIASLGLYVQLCQ